VSISKYTIEVCW